MNLSDNQKNIVDLIDGNLLVSASAGSGKTAVLVERILNLILNYNVSIDEILIITFTNAAAFEMQERILKSLQMKVNKENQDILNEQILLISNANIQTFHSFCLDILKNNYYKIGLNSNFNLLKDATLKMLINESLDETFSYYYEIQDDNFINLVNKYGGKYFDDKLKEYVILFYNFLQTKPNIHEAIEEIKHIYNLQQDQDILLHTSFGIFLKDDIINKLEKFKYYIKNFIDEGCHDDKALELFLSDLKNLDNINESLDEGYEKTNLTLGNLSFMRFKNGMGEDYEDYKDNRDNIKDYVEELKNKYFFLNDEDFRLYLKDIKQTIDDIVEVTLKFKEVFDGKKRLSNLIDFNDMEHLTLKLLEDNSLCCSLREKFKYIFIDEYQDTNYIQEYLISKIKRDNPSNVFMVGDIKQSIYSFRGAKVDLFHSKYKTYETLNHLKDSKENNKILLYENYRSRKEIVDSINFIFKNLMIKDISNVEYTKEEYLNYKGDYIEELSPDNYIKGEVSVDIFVNEDDKYVDDLEYDDDDIEESECILIRDYINKLVNSKEKIYKIFDKKIGIYRKIEYRDITILSRKIKASSKSNLLEETLLKSDIPVYYDGGQDFFSNIEVIVILSLFKIIDNPLDDLDLLTVLRSSIFNFNEQDLIMIRLFNKEEFLYNNILNILTCNIKDYEKGFIDKCRYFINKVKEYRHKSIYMKIDDFVWYLYDDTKYYFFVSFLESGIERQNNLKFIFNLAKEFRKTNSSGLFGFIQYIKNSKKVKEDITTSKNISANENVVKIMSIHKSKGLEFPVVILCNTGCGFNFRNLNSKFILDDDLGIGISHIDYENNLETDIMVKRIIRLKLLKNLISEELRILYVALTRAKEKLYIVGTYKNNKCFDRVLNIEKCKSYLDLIVNCLTRHEDGQILREKLSKNNIKIDLHNSKFDIRVIYKKDINFNNIKNSSFSGDIKKFKDELENNNIEDKDIDKNLNFKYPYLNSIDTPLNVSVSEISSELDDNNLSISSFVKPTFLDDNKKKIYTKADIGNLYHKFMQNIILRNNIDIFYINQEISRMEHRKIFSSEDIAFIDTNKIMRFFENNLGKRLLEAFNLNSLIKREFEFLIKDKVNKISDIEFVRIQGIIDLFFYENNKIIIIDYKTDKMISRDVNTRYINQLNYYSRAIEKIFKIYNIEKYIYSFDLDEEIKI